MMDSKKVEFIKIKCKQYYTINVILTQIERFLIYYRHLIFPP